LTRTCLWQSWEVGFQHFLEHLIDADWSICAGNWMWVSSSAFERLLDSSKCSIVAFGQRLDPKGIFIKRYVPELRNLPEVYIHHPWTAPIEIQKKYGVIIGQNGYPFPMIDLTQAMEINCQRMKKIRESIIDKPHVRPSNEDEVRMFFWIIDEMSIKCN
jgi:cryptochrome